MNGRKRNGALAIAVIVAMILGTFVGAFNLAASGASPLPTPFVTAAERDAAPLVGLSNALHAGVGLVAALQSAASYALGPYSYLSAKVTPAQWSAVAALASNPRAGLTTDGILTDFISVGGVIAVAAICAATAGIACAVIAVAVVIAIVISAVICALGLFNVFGDCSPPSGAASAAATGQLMLADAGQLGFNVLATSTTNLLNALNGTQTALSYEAASVAVTQLGNSSFNIPQDLAQSGVAQQMASEAWGVETGLATVYAKLLANFNFYEALGNPTAFYCALNIANAFGPVPGANPTGSDLCANGPDSGSSNLYIAYGQVFPSMEMSFTDSESGSTNFGSGAFGCYPMWIQTQSSYWVATSTPLPTIVLIPVDGTQAWTNVTITPTNVGTHEETNATWTVPSGGYWVCSSSSTVSVTVGFSFTMPLSVAAQNQLVAGSSPSVVWENPNTAPSGGNPMSGTAGEITIGTGAGLGPMSELVNSGGHCVGQIDQWGGNFNGSTGINDPTCLAGFPREAGAEKNLVGYLATLQDNAVNSAITYWGFLKFTLGYSSVSQVPPDCLIPTPSSLLPPNIPPSVLATMSPTQLLTWYQAQLRQLAQTFNLNETLNSTTICGVHPKWNAGNGTAGFGVYATGYAYVPIHGIKNSNGSAAQVFGKPTTWNISGTFYMAPVVSNISVPLNKTFELGTVNAVTFFVEPFVKNSTINGPTHGDAIVNATGPTTCITANKSGCLQLALDAYVTRPLNGNSTANAGLTGSVYPTSVTSSFNGTAVFLTACFVAQAGATQANATYTSTGTAPCKFTTQKLNATGSSCQNGILYSSGVAIGTCGGGGGGVLVLTGCSSSLFLFGPFVAYVSSLFGSNSFIGCAVAWIAVVLLVILLLFGIVEVIAFGVRQARKGGGNAPRGG